MFDSYK